MNRDSVVGIATGYGLGAKGLELDIFLLSALSRLVIRPTQPPIHWVPGALSPGVKL
jgi:hypothetical protein